MRVAALGPSCRARSRATRSRPQILERAADELVLAAQSVASRLEMRGDEFTFVLAGGVFRAVPWLVERARAAAADVAPRCSVQLLNEEPAAGAVWLALAEARGGAHVPRYKALI